jgi:hypothetical protein
MESRMRGNPQVRFGKRVGGNRIRQLLFSAPDPTSRNLQPSEADKVLTRKMREGGKLLDIAVLDHLIVTRQNYFSFADEGLMPR